MDDMLHAEERKASCSLEISPLPPPPTSTTQHTNDRVAMGCMANEVEWAVPWTYEWVVPERQTILELLTITPYSLSLSSVSVWCFLGWVEEEGCCACHVSAIVACDSAVD
ncbi:unnamed protein product [Acanthocheilonema viteae]|uniref:Uncharacterized protein n=1 Tax=Acanthocheilonema viteae TaxID=6277 RepID=A0A498SKA1_ACAVI|nr:unnamed protein product [Acanthocheilonema viteae]